MVSGSMEATTQNCTKEKQNSVLSGRHGSIRDLADRFVGSRGSIRIGVSVAKIQVLIFKPTL